MTTHYILLHLLLIVSLILPLSCQEQRRAPIKYLFPEGYIGWVRIDWKVPDAPPLPVEDGYYIIKFPASGRIQTSSDLEYGWGKDQDYYYTDTSLRLLESTNFGEQGWVWAEGTTYLNDGKGNETEKYSRMFVGTREQFDKYGFKHTDAEGELIFGPIKTP